MRQVAAHYVMAVRRHLPQASSPVSSTAGGAGAGTEPGAVVIADPYRAAELLIADRDVLLAFFSRFDSEGNVCTSSAASTGESEGYSAREPTTGPFAAQFAQELMALQYLAQLLVASHVTGVVADGCTELYERYGLDGLRAVQCAIQGVQSKTRQERHDMVEKANTLYATKMLSKGSRSPTAPSASSREFAEEFSYLSDSTGDLSTLLGAANPTHLTSSSSGGGAASTSQQQQAPRKNNFWSSSS